MSAICCPQGIGPQDSGSAYNPQGVASWVRDTAVPVVGGSFRGGASDWRHNFSDNLSLNHTSNRPPFTSMVRLNWVPGTYAGAESLKANLQ